MTVVRSRLRPGLERTFVWRMFFYPLRCRSCDHRFRRVKSTWWALALLIAFAIATLFITARFLDGSRPVERQIDEPNIPL